MKDLDTISHHPAIEEIAGILSARTQNSDLAFFRVIIAYFFGKMAGSQRAVVLTKDRGAIPVNIYALSLAVSGAGKGHSIGIIEEDLLSGFRSRFLGETFPIKAEENMAKMATERAIQNNSTEEEELPKIQKEFKRLGALAFTFDSGTVPAVKQMRQKLMIGGGGSINMQIDEIGSNLVANTEVLNAFLELYDQGRIKQKLTKNTNENERSEELEGKTPTNMLLFGTPSKLLDGSKTEDEFYSFLETGYARRCIFAYGHRNRASADLTPTEIYHQLISPKNQHTIDKYAQLFLELADPAKFGWQITIEEDVAIQLLTYKIECENRADELPEHEEIRKAEISHRYFKALKLAGAMAFVDEENEITEELLWQAIKLVEESGTAFGKIFSREKNYVKLAKYLAAMDSELTHADLTEALPFYKGSQSNRNEMINLATAWGYRNHIIIKKTFEQGIEFYRGETLQETSLDKLRISYSDHVAYRYLSEEIKFDNLVKLVGLNGYHFTNHFLMGGGDGKGHRNEENSIAGFDMVIIDVDTDASLQAARDLLSEYTYIIYTTKRHTEEDHRYRIIMPINYRLELDSDDFRDFMQNVYDWIPFKKDEQTNQRSRKWLTNPGQVYTNEGALLDALKFIPKTVRNEEFRNSVVKLENLDNLERWFAQRMVSGNRNNHMLRFAMALYDSNLSYREIETRVMDFNSKLDNQLPTDELKNTVLITVARKFANQGTP